MTTDKGILHDYVSYCCDSTARRDEGDTTINPYEDREVWYMGDRYESYPSGTPRPEGSPQREPDCMGVYRNMPDGTQQHVIDFDPHGSNNDFRPGELAEWIGAALQWLGKAMAENVHVSCVMPKHLDNTIAQGHALLKKMAK